MKIKGLIAFAIAMIFAANVAAQIVVTPANTQGWSKDETAGTGEVNFVVDASAPGAGALQLKTFGPADRAQYQHGASTLLSSITELSYDTKQVSGPPEAAAAYQLESCLVSATPTTCGGYTTLNFEPYLNPASGPIVAGVWQSWDVDAGLFWSTRTVTCPNGIIQGGAGGSGGLYTLSAIKTACPNAIVLNHYVNVGSGATLPYDVYTDTVNFNGTIYDFEPFLVATSASQCKKDGWKTLFRADGTPFKNQGDCIQYVNTAR
jgi:hypothetical protein